MRKSILPFFVFVLASLLSCQGNKSAEANNSEAAAGDSAQMSQGIDQQMEAANDRWNARKAKGDTLALPYKELETYLPAEISGYTKGSPQGSQVNMPGMGSWSQTEQDYTEGEKRIKISIIDYNSSQMAFSSATAIYKMGFSAEDDSQKSSSVDLGVKDVAAYETVYKQEPRAQLIVVAGDRFYINLESNGSNDTEQLRSIAKNISSAMAAKF